MRKYFALFLSVLLVLGITIQARAEMESGSFTGRNYRELQRFIQVYNSYGNTITANSVVILDMLQAKPLTDTVAVTLALTSPSELTIGVADEDIVSGALGKICTYGPHLIRVNPLQSGTLTVTKGTALGTASATYTMYPNSGYAYTAIGQVGSADSLSNATATYPRTSVGIALCSYQTTPASLWWAWINVAPDL